MCDLIPLLLTLSSAVSNAIPKSHHCNLLICTKAKGLGSTGFWVRV